MNANVNLRDDVLKELKREPRVNASHIEVAASEGLVTPRGYVHSHAEKYAAERAAKRLYGVKAVANELEVNVSGSATRSDEVIAQACRKSVKFN